MKKKKHEKKKRGIIHPLNNLQSLKYESWFHSKRGRALFLLLLFIHPNHPRNWVWGEFGYLLVVKGLLLVSKNHSRSRRGGTGFDHAPSNWLLSLSLIFNTDGCLEGKHVGLRRRLLWLWTRVEQISGEEVVLLKTSHEIKLCVW